MYMLYLYSNLVGKSPLFSLSLLISRICVLQLLCHDEWNKAYFHDSAERGTASECDGRCGDHVLSRRELGLRRVACCLISNAHHKYPRRSLLTPRFSTSHTLPRSRNKHSFTSVMPSLDRPGPLQPYDIRLFAAATAPGTPGHSRPNKRPHSPSVGSPAAPAKRRMRGSESVNTPRLAKSPLSGSSTSARFAPAHFHALLQGPDSPAKRLDFGSSEASDSTACEALSNRGGSGTPRRSPKRTPLRCRLSSSRKTGSPSPSATSCPAKQIGADDARPTVRVPVAAQVLIPRAVVPPDPQSVHYPGFVIHQDPHIVLPSSSSIADTETDVVDQDINKENVAPPRRKALKKVSAPCTPTDKPRLKSSLFSPSSTDAKTSFPKSPHPRHVQDYLSTPRPVSIPKARDGLLGVSPAATLVGATPTRTPLDRNSRRKMRQVLEDEVDGVDDNDELVL